MISANKVRVRITRGSIECPPHVYSVGDDCEIEEPLAYALRKSFLVLVHGQDDLHPDDELQSADVRKPRAILGESETLDIVTATR